MVQRVRPAIGAILDNIQGIENALRNFTIERYAADWMVRHAVERGFEIIAEAVKQIPEDLRHMHPEVDWASIIGIGATLHHEYDTVVDELVFTAATERLEGLKAAVIAIELALNEPID